MYVCVCVRFHVLIRTRTREDNDMPHNAAAADENAGWIEGVGCPSGILTQEGGVPLKTI